MLFCGCWRSDVPRMTHNQLLSRTRREFHKTDVVAQQKPGQPLRSNRYSLGTTAGTRTCPPNILKPDARKFFEEEYLTGTFKKRYRHICEPPTVDASG